MAGEVVYKVVLREGDDGFSAQCPALPGCWSQGVDEADALDNIADAIREYLASIDDELSDTDVVLEVRIAV
jgi:predicted RNase H-like HicB family nuclease